MRHLVLLLPLALFLGCECNGRTSDAFPISHARLFELLGPDDPVVQDLYGRWTNDDACKTFCDSVNPPEERKDWKGCFTQRRWVDEGQGGAGGSRSTAGAGGSSEEKPLETSCVYEFPAKCNNGGNYL